MVDASDFRELVSGRQRGWSAGLIRGALDVPAAGYAATIYVRNKLFDWRLRTVHRVNVPLISVGNLTLGGTGKSPFVLWLARWLQQAGLKPAVLSRGYGAAAGMLNDEAMELQSRAPEIIQLQSADRVAIARRAILDSHAQVLLLDDGFQHRRLARDLDIVLIDASEPFGFGRMFPRGLLREPIGALRRAGAVVLTRADQVSAEERERIRHIVADHAPRAVWSETRFEPTTLVDDRGVEHGLAELATARVFGFASVGQPRNFRQSLQGLAGQLVGFKEFPDHHRFADRDFKQLVAFAQQSSAERLVCTCKDLVKIPTGACDPIPLRAIRIDTRIESGRADLEQLLRTIVRPNSPI